MKQLFTILILLFSVSLFGQNNTTRTQVQSDSTKPVLIIVLKSTMIELDSVSIQKINPDWIDKIEVIKEQKYSALYGNKNGTVYIYPKRKYRKQIAEALKK